MECICPKCNGKLIKCVAPVGIGFNLNACKFPLKNPLTKIRSEIFPYVCFECGYTEWYVEDFKKLK